jgi:nucleoside-diphosphate-sugar epimerase
MNCFNKKNILITGGLGFIGSNLARRSVELGANVTLVDSLIPEYGGSFFNISDIEDQVQVNVIDVRDVHSMKSIVQGQHYLFNLAGQTSHMDSMKDPYTDLEINCRAQLSILEACRQNNTEVKIVFAGTRQIYGKPNYLPVDEAHPLHPVDVNGINKIAGESYHMLYNNVYGIQSSVLRLTNTYGPGMRVKDDRQTFLGIWIRMLVGGRPFEVWGGEQMRDFNYIDDVVDAFLMVAASEKANGNIFNLGGIERISLRDAAALLISIAGCGEYLVREFPEDRKRIDIGDYYSDYSLIESVIGWHPRIALEQGFRQTIDYYRKYLSHYL